MTDRGLRELLGRLDLPVAPAEDFAQSLLERLEAVFAGAEMSPAELDEQVGEALPLREAMSVIRTDPLAPMNWGLPLGPDDTASK